MKLSFPYYVKSIKESCGNFLYRSYIGFPASIHILTREGSVIKKLKIPINHIENSQVSIIHKFECEIDQVLYCQTNKQLVVTTYILNGHPSMRAIYGINLTEELELKSVSSIMLTP